VEFHAHRHPRHAHTNSTTSKSVDVANSGSSFSDQLAVVGGRGSVTYVVTASNVHVNVTPSGLIETVGATVGAPLPVGAYTVSGTDADTYGDTGTWSYTLTVTKGTILCNGPDRKVNRSNSGRDFDDQLVASGWSGSVTFNVTSPNSHLHISNGGNVTTVGGPLPAGTYTFSGTDTDPTATRGNGVTRSLSRHHEGLLTPRMVWCAIAQMWLSVLDGQ